METFTHIALGWVLGCFTIFGWAVFGVLAEQRRGFKAALVPIKDNVRPPYPPKDNN